MVKPACFDSNVMKKGAWSKEEDNILRAHIQQFGHLNWRLLPLLAGLARSGKSCRLRWVNNLKPGLKLGKFTKHEEDLIKLHKQLGNKWSAIAAKLPGRTDSEIKNYWHVHIKCSRKRSRAGTRVVSAETPQLDEQSSEINSCITCTTDHQETPVSNKDSRQGLSTDNAENIDALNSVAEPHQTCFSQLNIDLPPFP